MNEQTAVVADLGRTWVLRLFHRQLALKQWLRSGASGAPPTEDEVTPAAVSAAGPLPPTLTGLAALVEGLVTRARST